VSAFSLAKRLDISQKEAKKYIDTFFERYSGVREFFNKMIKTCEEIGYVETMFGRKRFIK
jgi:DNA polymerase-1